MYSALYAQKTLQYANSMQSGKERNLLISSPKVQPVCLMSSNKHTSRTNKFSEGRCGSLR